MCKFRIPIDPETDRELTLVIDEQKGKASVTITREYGPDHTTEIDLRQPAKSAERAA